MMTDVMGLIDSTIIAAVLVLSFRARRRAIMLTPATLQPMSKLRSAMAIIEDIPTLGEIPKSIEVYIIQSARILDHPIKFSQALKIENRAEVQQAIRFFTASMIVTYLILIP